MIPLNYVCELLDHRIEGFDEREVVWVPDDLFYDYKKSVNYGAFAVEIPDPNMVYKGKVIRPQSVKPTGCCHCCCCKER